MIYVLPFDLYEDWKELMFAKEVAENIRCKMFKPTADVVAVVRCKDCKYNAFQQPNGTIHCHAKRNLICEFRNPDDFCSYGERKE